MAKITHVLETQQFREREVLDELFDLADNMKLFDETDLSPDDLEKCKNMRLPQEPRRKLLANVFYEVSTRTRFSFDAAMQRLGGDVVGTEAAARFSSVVKGENLPDTIRTISSYTDVIVLRHFDEGSAKIASNYSHVPVINAGDGPGQHPTQALLDLYTVRDELGRIDDLEVAMVGDLKYGRTVHSLIYLLAHQDQIKFYFISPEELRITQDIRDYMDRKGIPYEETEDLEAPARKVDILYQTRVQKERFPRKWYQGRIKALPFEFLKTPYERVKGRYVVDNHIAGLMKMDSRILHPFPRVNELLPEVDNDSRAAYFRQIKNSLYVRMALLKMVLDG